MAGDQYFFIGAPRQEILAIAEASIGEGGVDTNFIIAFRQTEELTVGKTETPVLFVIGGPIGNPIRVFRKRKQVRLDFAQEHCGMDWHAIVEHVQVTLLKVHHPSAGTVLDISVSDVPFLGDCPIEYGASGRNFEDLQRNAPLDHAESLTEAFSGNAPADRIKFGRESVQFLLDCFRTGCIGLLE